MDELQALLGRIIKRIMKLLTRTGHLIEEQGMTYLAEAGSDSVLAPLQAAACTYRIALGPRAGHKVLSLQTIPADRPIPHSQAASPCTAAYTPQCVVAPISAGSSSACAGISPAPAIANERLKRNQAGQVVLQLKSPYRDGTTHIVMSPLEYTQRLSGTGPASRGCI